MNKLILSIAALAWPTGVVAQGATASSPPEFARRAEHLKPGEWVWASQIAYGPLADLRRKLVRRLAHRGATLSGDGASGKPGPLHSQRTANFLAKADQAMSVSIGTYPLSHLVTVSSTPRSILILI